jgi:hypothetical protein
MEGRNPRSEIDEFAIHYIRPHTCQNAAQVRLPEHDHLVEAFPSDRNQLRVSILTASTPLVIAAGLLGLIWHYA